MTARGKVDSSPFAQVEPVRFETRGSLFIVGLRERFTGGTMETIPSLWAKFAPLLGSVSGRVDQAAYGVCFHGREDASFDYMRGFQSRTLRAYRLRGPG